LICSFEIIVNNIRLYLSTLVDSCVKANSKPSFEELDCIVKCDSWINRLGYFIEKVIDFIKKRDAFEAKLKTKKKPLDINDCIIRISDDMLVLNEHILRFLNF
ncbi:hypothetical protein PAEPH01_2153, partial [Pancytospora epiphaga]